MGAVNYRDGIAILQLILYPVLLITAVFIWRRVGWRAGGKCWRFVVTLSLLRIAGSICTLLSINNDSMNIIIAEDVCALIGIAPLLLTYVGLIGQIDAETRKINPRHLKFLYLLGFLGLILGIVGVSIMKDKGPFRANGEVKAAMGIFIALFVVITLATGWLASQLGSAMSVWQKKLLLAIGLSWPFLLIRLIYSAMGDFSTDTRFTVLSPKASNTNVTIYLCMSVLEELVAMGFCVIFGMSSENQKERKLGSETNFGLETANV
ncbi:hypothetical protein N7474_000696 [Penicillium riverlandense]|uniref:uncharacterized protein n=1 Tax=Penicillium riverlandense TaxID=1903569 RepID=UPI002548D2EF|nr:uncharacterized protein N7474_000696 [Penicillium riverlandense]KAJ5832385.1 hypothetical protein N7474_000696 [Penicillium riverlandense]